ncbi:adenosylmethionine--8-amino-7-oxononanoate transaminase [Flavitalea sp. BT771]|uniref:adenosylmethionine--8-amino-7-oxononanoate transaminase n=1 Tax=Flavitalea sp. BT771 TaxID=3063329 RepID=UPI0026E2ADC4|nr:adenosylmethionine--8-amino-7-oxononanoate transaminase [Flavitalea sp. BT771]MDO6431285.1 adenosylmethionine--8-amino-7-oxononanoate transaminase [Flavitalea sp. BT771]MDV6220193.1 adenosylmethionine--8-amino-7-oxononanoate transaminase [Flavitalea sp. BT771]
MQTKSLTDRDHEVIWHPYTQHKNKLPPIPVVRGKGTLLWDEKGNPYIDAISSWWVTLHGHAHPHIAQKIYQQALVLEQVIFTGFTHEPAVSLAERLLPLLPGDLSRIFYSDNGSTAVEVALKMAIQYWKNKGDDRKKILALRNSYHGDTFGSMSVSGRSLFTAAFQDYLFEPVFIDAPDRENIGQLKELLRRHGCEMACFIYEPLLQGAGGMHMYDAALLDELMGVAKEMDLLLIADEVLTGFGRTGELFAGNYLRNTADIICLSKGLTGGTMALGATAATERVFEAFLSDDRRKSLFHGHSFTANPLACAAALASLDLLLETACAERIRGINTQHAAFAEKIKAYDVVRDVRTLGTVVAFELSQGEDGYINPAGLDLTQKAMEEGIYLRPLGNTVYILPPYCTTKEELDKIYDFLEKYIKKARP